MTSEAQNSALIGKLQHTAGVELGAAITSSLKGRYDPHQAAAIVEKRVRDGTYVMLEPLSELLARTGNQSLYALTKQRLFSEPRFLLPLYRSGFADPEIESRLCKELYSLRLKPGMRGNIAECMSVAGTAESLPTLEQILEELQGKSAVNRHFTPMLGPVEDAENRSDRTFLETVARAIKCIESRGVACPDDGTDDKISSQKSVAFLISQGEGQKIEFKSSLRWDFRQNNRNDDLIFDVAKTVAAFYNAEGGTLLIGVSDDGSILGLKKDYALLTGTNKWDEFHKLLVDRLSSYFGLAKLTSSVRITKESLDCEELCRLDVQPLKERMNPAEIAHKDKKYVFVRYCGTSRQYSTAEYLEYLRSVLS